jgi:hypothetical protein
METLDLHHAFVVIIRPHPLTNHRFFILGDRLAHLHEVLPQAAPTSCAPAPPAQEASSR